MLPIEYKRIKQIREELKLTQAEMAEALGVSSMADIERGRTKISGWATMRLLQQYHINPLWLFGESEKKYLNPFEANVLPKAITVDNNGKENILMVNTKAAAGYGQNIGDAEYMRQLPAFSMPIPEYRNASFRGFQITGDSMVPLVQSGDWVLTKAVDSFEAVRENKIYIIVEPESVRLKKIQKSKNGAEIKLISLNPEYPPTEIPTESILELWEYHSRISFGAEKIQGLSLQKIQEDLNELKKMVDGK